MKRDLFTYSAALLWKTTFLFVVLPSASPAASPEWLTARDAEARALVAKMTLAEKVGQMTQPDWQAIKDPEDIHNLFLGSILCGGGSDPDSGNSLQNWTDLYEGAQQKALSTRLQVPLLFGIDAVHGNSNVLGAVIFPHNIGLGCTGDPALIEKIGQVTARETRATGIQWAFAPCVAVPRDIRWGRTYEGYSEDPTIVATLGEALLRGLQGQRITGRENVLACAKHFVGDGGTAFKTAAGKGLLDQGDARITEDEMRTIHMAGYPLAIDAGVGTVMPSYSSWNGEKCTGSKRLLTDILKDELGFEGFVISDYNAIDQLVPPTEEGVLLVSNNASGQISTPDYKKCIELAINAGVDMVMVTSNYREYIRLLQELVEEGKVPLSRIDDAVTRILRVKLVMGMMDSNAALMADPNLAADFGSTAHREVAREAVRRSLVLLKNEGGALPLSSQASHIHVTGRGADDLGMQCGGWTIDWQGKRGALTPGGTTIFCAIQSAAGADTKVTHSPDGSGAEEADVVVVVVGETPYAEMEGDQANLSLAKEDLSVLSEAESAGVPVVLLILSGRPLILGKSLGKADAIIAAWLPGTEGTGVADILFGTHSPTGKLSFSWPQSMEQVPLGHDNSSTSASLFPLGFGLTYE
ncbi:MAG: glycoside hydrolase family 3 protein [Roseibacillus sp.]